MLPRLNPDQQVLVDVQQTAFTHDILGRYVYNTFSEAKQSGTFDIVIIGGGTFGLTLAQDLFERSRPLGPAIKPGNYRILVLEGGPYTLPEHVQDIPSLGAPSPGTTQADLTTLLDSPSAPRLLNSGNALPATRQELINSNLDKQAVFENWGMPWNSSIRFGGLAYCLGGRSLYFGGWSPRYLATEMETAPADPFKSAFPWPQTLADDLNKRYFLEGAKQTGASTSNDYISGDMHTFFRKKLFNLYNAIPNIVPLNELPDYVTEASEDQGQHIQDVKNGTIPPDYAGFLDSLRVDAPLAVQILSRPGFFPFNKFSSVPLAIDAARRAFGDANDKLGNTDKRFMIVTNCHVKGLRTRTYMLATGATVQEVDGIFVRSKATGDDFLDLSGAVQGNVQRRPTVILTMGAIESARMALLTPGAAAAPNGSVIGNNLMVHLRKNAQFTVPIPPGLNLTDLELTALLVRCRTKINGAFVHYHFQISASAMPAGSGAGKSDALLFQSVPDLDNIRHFADTAPGEIDVSIRAVGEILPNPQNSVVVPTAPGHADLDEALIPRALATLVPRTSPGADIDSQVMKQMDQGIDFLAQNLFGAIPGPAYKPAAQLNPDGLGTTFHESGTLRAGDDPMSSVVNPDCQFHFVTNLYAGDAAVLPTCGSANPVMNGVAIRRRLARHLVPEGDAGQPQRPFVGYPPPAAPPPKNQAIPLFDGKSFANWRMSGRGTFHIVDGALQSVPSFDLGMLWCTKPMPKDYVLELEFFIRTFQTNSGVFVRFKNPDGVLAPDGTPFSNPAWSAVYTGFEIQIDNSGAGQPTPGMAIHRTGAVYAVSYPGNPSEIAGFPAATATDFVNPRDATVLGWNHYRIEVSNDVIKVNLNGMDTARYTIPDPALIHFPPPYDQSRGRFPAVEPTFVGLQSYSNYSFTTAFRNIRITVL
jgi:choline dehydrogenase-like flavoprotein